ncbi:MAG: CHAT domain-containing protein [Phycisphaerae bacterium]
MTLEAIETSLAEWYDEPHDRLVARLDGAFASEGDRLAIADHARQLATSDVEWSLRLSAALIDSSALGSAARVRAMAAKAHALCYRGAPGESIAILNDARGIAARLENPFELAGVLMASVQPHFLLGNLEQATTAATAARDEFARGGHTQHAAMAEVNLGGVLRRLNKPEEALLHFDNARPVLAGDPVRRAMIDSNRAEALLDLDQYSAALQAFEEALGGFDAVQNWHAAALVEGNIADLRSRQGHPDLALRHFEQARRRLEAIGSEAQAESARLLAEEAECLARIGARRESLTRYHTAIETLEQAGLAYEAARARLMQGTVMLRLGDFERAGETLGDARQRFTALGDVCGVADADSAIAEVRVRTGRLEDAIILLGCALERVGAWPSRSAAIATELAIRMLHQLRIVEADRLIAMVDAIVDRIGITPLMARLNYAKALACHARGDSLGAMARLRDATDTLERLHATLPADRLRYAFLADADEMYQTMLRFAFDQGDRAGIEAAFGSLERASARGLLDLMSAATQGIDSAAADDDDAQVLADIDECREAIGVAYSRIGLGATGPEDLAQTKAAGQRLSELETRYERLESRLLTSRRMPSVFARPLEFAAFQAKLAADQAVVRYFVESDTYGALVLRHDGAVVRRSLGRVDQTGALARRIGFLVDQAIVRAATGLPPRDAGSAWSALCESLDAMLVAPLKMDLRGATTVGLIPAGELHGLPLHTLAPSLADLTCVYPPSATIGVELRRGVAPDAALRVLTIGVDDPIAPQMKHEAAEIAAAVAGSRKLVGESATADAMIAAARDADVIHLATHSVFGESNPLSSRIALADRWMDAREIARMRLPGSVVVLAGCETGRSGVDTGAERFGLIRAFLAAGATTVIASHWPLADQTSREFFIELYRRLSQAGSTCPARCLAQTQIEFARRGVHPAFWAGLFVVGGLQS